MSDLILRHPLADPASGGAAQRASAPADPVTRPQGAEPPASHGAPALKVAIVHEWLTTFAGSEKVTEQLLQMYPHADLFAVVDFLPAQDRAFLQGRTPRTTFIQRLPGAARHYRSYLPLMPLAIEQLDVSAYDLVISSNHAVAKGVITGPHQTHISYVHSPMRYAWDLQHQYLNESGMARGVKSAVARLCLHYLRFWDQRSANGVDHFAANSAFIAKRIQKAYRRQATVVYPPVDIDAFQLHAQKEDFYLCASRLVPYKRVPLIVQAFAAMPDKRLIVIGDGPDLARVQALATANVQVLGFLPTARLVHHMQRAKALVFAAEEDFGITPVEAQACGTPVIAYGRGGSLETVRADGDAPTGVFFSAQTVESITAAVQDFDADPGRFHPTAIRQHAAQFSRENFRARMADFIAHCLDHQQMSTAAVR